jgi:hypothetical protein
LAKAAPSAIRGSVNFRQTDVFDRVAGSAARLSIQSRPAQKSKIACALAIGPRHQPGKPADGLRPVERQEVILHRQHGGRVDRLAHEDAFDQLAALGQAEDLRQGPWGV